MMNDDREEFWRIVADLQAGDRRLSQLPDSRRGTGRRGLPGSAAGRDANKKV